MIIKNPKNQKIVSSLITSLVLITLIGITISSFVYEISIPDKVVDYAVISAISLNIFSNTFIYRTDTLWRHILLAAIIIPAIIFIK